jgi:uncharacterized protein YdhG (YjbR/CyaY superfamily)
MTTKPPSNVDEYIASFPPEVRAILERLRAAIKRAAPNAKESIAYRMPAYTLDGPLVYFAAHKAHVGLYALPSAVAAFAGRLEGYETSKGTIRFPFERELPIGLIEEILRFRVAENEERTAKKGGGVGGASGRGAAKVPGLS